MRVHTNIDLLPAFRKAVVTIGTFDGIHSGHRHIITQLKEEAEAIQGETVIITFHPHPRKVVHSRPGDIYLLTTMEERIRLLDELGIDHLVIVPFTEAFARQEANDYIEKFLVDRFHPHTIIIGYDHRFGRNRSGDYRLLEAMADRYGYTVKEIPEHILNRVTVSSTLVRESLLKGDIDKANEFLGYPYFFEGTVIHGSKRGRKIGFPTANIRLLNEEKLIPSDGVYAVTAQLPGSRYPTVLYKGMMNIGYRPTVDGSAREIEIHLFNFSEEIYDQIMRVSLHRYIRPEQKFSGIEELKQQLATDKLEAEKWLES